MKETPQGDGTRARAVKTLHHQSQLLKEPAIARAVDVGRKMDQLRKKPSVQALNSAKRELDQTDMDITRLRRAASRDAIFIASGLMPNDSTMPNIIYPEEIGLNQEHFDHMYQNFGVTHEIDPGFTPEQVRGNVTDTPCMLWRSHVLQRTVLL